jgi:hypothetical protein
VTEEPEALKILRQASNEELERLIRGEQPSDSPVRN